MGHTDTLMVGDCGLPIPQETQRIDLALRKGTPGSPELWHETLHRFPNIKVTYVSHEKLKELTKKSRAVVRTGETTSYANVILVSGVTF